MSPETEGKIMVALIISLIAFGFGSGVGIVIAISQNDTTSPFSLNFTEENPQMPVMNPQTTDLQEQRPSGSQDNLGSEEVYIPNSNKNTTRPGNNNESNN